MSSAAKKKQDEKNTKILRELVSLPGNKHCFDCNQRGPTYVNMTIGSFICTGCSGILRGLNPPHRVKSISMASFTPEEMEFLKSRGNDHCRRVWLGLHDRQAGMPPEPDSRSNEQSVRDFMAVKYEKKRYFVTPSEELFAEARALNQPVFDRIEKGQGAKNNRSILGINAPPSATAAKLAGPPAPTSASASASAASGASTITARPTAASVAPLQAAASQPGRGGNTADLLGGDLFGGGGGAGSNGVATSAAATAAFHSDASSSGGGGFANFDLPAYGGGSGASFGQFPADSANLFGGAAGLAQPVAPAASLAAAQPLQPAPVFGGVSAAPVSAAAPADKYAAFADLFNSGTSGPSAFSAAPITVTAAQPVAVHGGGGAIDWTGGGFGGGGGGGGSGGINWGGASSGNNGYQQPHQMATTSAPTSTAPWSGGQPSWDAMGGAGSVSGVSSSQSWNAGWGGAAASAAGAPQSSWAATSMAPAPTGMPAAFGAGATGSVNPFSNPFGAQPQPAMSAANPFGGPPSYFQQQQHQHQPPPPSAGTNPFL